MERLPDLVKAGYSDEKIARTLYYSHGTIAALRKQLGLKPGNYYLRMWLHEHYTPEKAAEFCGIRLKSWKQWLMSSGNNRFTSPDRRTTTPEAYMYIVAKYEFRQTIKQIAKEHNRTVKHVQEVIAEHERERPDWVARCELRGLRRARRGLNCEGVK